MWTVFEHEALRFDWTPSDLAALERLQRAAKTEILRPVVRHGHYHLQATEQVGLVRLGEQTIQVLPKLFRREGVAPEEQAQAATRALVYLLANTSQLAIAESGLTQLLSYPGNWFEGLIALFTTQLTDLWLRGPQRTYQAVEDELPILKGRWRLAEQLRRPEQYQRLAVRYDEFTVDQPLNQVLAAAVDVLWRLTEEAGNRRRLGILREWLTPVTLLPASVAAQMPLPPLTRLNQHYAPILNLARLLLTQAAPQLTGGAREMFAFVFDMNRLFEDFLTQFIRRHRHSILPAHLAHSQLLAQAQGVQRYLARRDDGRDAFLLRPDLVVRDGNAVPLIIDMKYKRLDPEQRRLGIAPADFYQMLAYAQRYQCAHVLLLYPQTAEVTQPVRHVFTPYGSPTRIVVQTVDLRNDLSQAVHRRHLLAELRQGFAHVN